MSGKKLYKGKDTFLGSHKVSGILLKSLSDGENLKISDPSKFDRKLKNIQN